MTVMGTTTTLISLAEFERLAEGPDQIELLKGELIRMPPPNATIWRFVTGSMTA